MIANNFVVVIPAFNESKTIKDVVESIPVGIDIIVVDDGSKDETFEIASQSGAIVIRHETNLGYESALETGLNNAIDFGYAYAITMDADGQHNAFLLLEFIGALSNGADLVIGRRNKVQRFGEAVFSVLGHLLWGVQDPLCGMKGYKLSLLREWGPFDTKKIIGAEFAIKQIARGASFTEINVVTKERSDKSRYGEGLKINIRIVLALFRLIWLTCLKNTRIHERQSDFR